MTVKRLTMAAQDASQLPRSGPMTPWEERTRQIIDELRKDRLKADQRRLAAERQVADIDNQIAVLQRTIDQERAKMGMSKAPLVVSPQEAEPYKGISPKDMLLRWADDHDDEIVMNDAAQFLAAAGLFRDAQQAAGTLYTTIRRMSEFVKVVRGVYRRGAPGLRAVGGDNVIDLDDTPF